MAPLPMKSSVELAASPGSSAGAGGGGDNEVPIFLQSELSLPQMEIMWMLLLLMYLRDVLPLSPIVDCRCWYICGGGVVVVLRCVIVIYRKARGTRCSFDHTGPPRVK